MRSSLCFFLAIFAAAPCALAQEPLTLDQCLALARKNSPALHVADDAIRASSLASSQISRTALPQLKGVAGATYAPVTSQVGYDPALTNGGQIAGQLIVQESLYDGGLRGIKADQFDLDAERLLHERRRTDRDLTFAVQQAFIEVLRSEREVSLRREGVEQDSSYLSLVQSFYLSGQAGYTDVLKTQVQLASARIALQQSSESFRTASIALNELLGLPPDSSVAVAGSLESLVAGAAEVPDTTFGENLDLRIAGLSYQRTALEADLARHERYPTISVFGDAGYFSSLDNLRLPSSERVNALGYSIGVGVELPLFSWGTTALEVEQKEIEADALLQQNELLRRSLSSSLRSVKISLASARSRLNAAHANIARAEENFLLTRSKFAGGGALSLEVLSARQLLTDTKLTELEALATIQVLTARLQQLTTPSYAH